MEDTRVAYPLEWPAGWPRTNANESARFSVTKWEVSRFHPDHTRRVRARATISVAVKRLYLELRRLGATDMVLSTNVPLRLDGLPRADAREPQDHGAAVYFYVEGQPRALACDKWDRVADNVIALAKHVEAIRGQLRWGVGTTAQAFGGYKALPPEHRHWRDVLDLRGVGAVSRDMVRVRARELLRVHHPDRGGDHDRAAEITRAVNEAEAEVAA